MVNNEIISLLLNHIVRLIPVKTRHLVLVWPVFLLRDFKISFYNYDSPVQMPYVIKRSVQSLVKVLYKEIKN